MAVRKKKTIPFNFSEKHMAYIYACQFNTYNILGELSVLERPLIMCMPSPTN